MSQNYKNLSINNINGEVWKEIPGWNELYAISNKGRVKSLSRYKTIGARGLKLMPEIIRKQNLCKGYLAILLYKNNDYNEKWQVHRLVALMFKDNPENKLTVNHLDTDKLNNDASNLEWATHSEQQIHAVKNNLRAKTLGENSNLSMLTNLEVLEIRRLYDTKDVTRKKLAAIYGVNVNTIHCIVNRETWKHI